MIPKILELVKARFNDIMLFIIIVLLILLAFAVGFITAKNQLKQPIEITNGTHA